MSGPRPGKAAREMSQARPGRRVIVPGGSGNKGVTRKVLPPAKGAMTLDQRFTMIQQLRQESSVLSKNSRQSLLQKKRGLSGPSEVAVPSRHTV
jgi:hypothetical protein